MILFRISMWMHVFLSVLLAGYALYWFVVAAALAGRPRDEAQALLSALAGARWPPVGPLRPRLPWTGWAFLAALLLTSVPLLIRMETLGAMDMRFAITLMLVALVAVVHGVLVRSPRARLAYLQGVAVLTVLVVSLLGR